MIKIKSSLPLKKAHLVIILCLLLHALIIIAVPDGHGVGLMALFDIFLPVFIHEMLFSANGFTGYGILFAMAILSVLGKLLLILSLFKRFEARKSAFRTVGVIFLILAYVMVCIHNGSELEFQLLSGIFGGPFLVCAVYILRAIYLDASKKDLQIQ